jgi:hypothetical protein
MKFIYLFCLLGIMSIISGCATTANSSFAYYEIGLKGVERPLQAKEKYGEQKITAVQDAGISKDQFEDDVIKILWSPTASQITFNLTNKTPRTIKIIWDDAAYIDINGVGHRVMHEGVIYSDRNNPQPPSIVVRNGTLDDLVFPTDNVFYFPGGGWHESPLFPRIVINELELKYRNELYKGKTFQILLPLQIEDNVNEYIFTFEIKDVRLESGKL